MKSQKYIIVVVILLILAGYSYLKKPVVNEVTQEDQIMEKVDDSMVVDDIETNAIQLNASNFTFKVEEIRASVGDDLVVKVTNDQGVHDFVIDELGVSTGVIPEGESKEISIPTDKPGTYEYYCSIGQHRTLGMKGVLIIE